MLGPRHPGDRPAPAELQLKPTHLQDLYESRLKAGRSPSTVHHLHAMLRRALGMAERWELVSRNVAQWVSPPCVPKYKIMPLTVDAGTQVPGGGRGHPFRGRFRCGPRDWATPRRTARAAMVRRRPRHASGRSRARILQRANGRLQILEPKTEESVRDVALAELGAARASVASRAPACGTAATRFGVGGRRSGLPNVWGRYMAPDLFTRRSWLVSSRGVDCATSGSTT